MFDIEVLAHKGIFFHTFVLFLELRVLGRSGVVIQQMYGG